MLGELDFQVEDVPQEDVIGRMDC